LQRHRLTPLRSLFRKTQPIAATDEVSYFGTWIWSGGKPS